MKAFTDMSNWDSRVQRLKRDWIFHLYKQRTASDSARRLSGRMDGGSPRTWFGIQPSTRSRKIPPAGRCRKAIFIHWISSLDLSCPREKTCAPLSKTKTEGAVLEGLLRTWRTGEVTENTSFRERAQPYARKADTMVSTRPARKNGLDPLGLPAFKRGASISGGVLIL